jgi:hypothetical protein
VPDRGEVTVSFNDDLSPFPHLWKEFREGGKPARAGRGDILK